MTQPDELLPIDVYKEVVHSLLEDLIEYVYSTNLDVTKCTIKITTERSFAHVSKGFCKIGLFEGDKPISGNIYFFPISEPSPVVRIDFKGARTMQEMNAEMWPLNQEEIDCIRWVLKSAPMDDVDAASIQHAFVLAQQYPTLLADVKLLRAALSEYANSWKKYLAFDGYQGESPGWGCFSKDEGGVKAKETLAATDRPEYKEEG